MHVYRVIKLYISTHSTFAHKFLILIAIPCISPRCHQRDNSVQRHLNSLTNYMKKKGKNSTKYYRPVITNASAILSIRSTSSILNMLNIESIFLFFFYPPTIESRLLETVHVETGWPVSPFIKWIQQHVIGPMPEGQLTTRIHSRIRELKEP